ncbi:hypothetical protein [Nocardia sp. NPDC005978]|uniref:hypothetical protein n=1 Tax=unclassified Nocardia TaxID=2637762 RepID=UPI0033B44073
MKIAGIVAVASGALILPAVLAPTASAEVEALSVSTGLIENLACDAVGETCRIVVATVGTGYTLPIVVTVNGKTVAMERHDYPDRERSGATGTWRPTAKGTYTFVATQGSSSKSVVVEVTRGIDTGSLTGILPSGSGS